MHNRISISDYANKIFLLSYFPKCSVGKPNQAGVIRANDFFCTAYLCTATIAANRLYSQRRISCIFCYRAFLINGIFLYCSKIVIIHRQLQLWTFGAARCAQIQHGGKNKIFIHFPLFPEWLKSKGGGSKIRHLLSLLHKYVLTYRYAQYSCYRD